MEVNSPKERKHLKRKLNPKECLYHSDSASFMSVMKEVGRALLISSSLLKQSAMAVCSCRTSRASSKRKSVAELQILLASCENTDELLLSCLCMETQQGKEESPSPMTIQFVEKALHVARTHGRESHVRFAALLKSALKQDFSVLQKETEIGGKQHSEAKQSERKKTPPYVMIRKRKKQSNSSYVLTLPMFGGNSKLLQAENEIGKKFRVFSVKYKPCIVEIDYEATGAAMACNLQKTIVKIWCDKDKYSSIQNHLIISAQTLQKRLTRNYEEKRRLHKRNMASRDEAFLPRIPRLCLARVADPERIREEKWEDFSKKNHAEKQSKMKSKHQKKNVSVKCIQCHNTFTKATANMKESNGKSQRQVTPEAVVSQSSCRYHPGYFMEKFEQWSCCMLNKPNSLQRADISTVHRMSGCSLDPSHVWRYNREKKPNKKSKSNNNSNAFLFL